MSDYRCYLTRFGKVAAFEIAAPPDGAGSMFLEKADFLSKRKWLTSIEVSEFDRRIYIHAPADETIPQDYWASTKARPDRPHLRDTRPLMRKAAE
jgi:hypothetical protein